MQQGVGPPQQPPKAKELRRIGGRRGIDRNGSQAHGLLQVRNGRGGQRRRGGCRRLSGQGRGAKKQRPNREKANECQQRKEKGETVLVQ